VYGTVKRPLLGFGLIAQRGKWQVARCKMQDARCKLQVASCKLQVILRIIPKVIILTKGGASRGDKG
jgi:hypothetical protein